MTLVIKTWDNETSSNNSFEALVYYICSLGKKPKQNSLIDPHSSNFRNQKAKSSQAWIALQLVTN